MIVEIVPHYNLCQPRTKRVELCDLFIGQLWSVGLGIRQLEVIMDKSELLAHRLFGPFVDCMG